MKGVMVLATKSNSTPRNLMDCTGTTTDLFTFIVRPREEINSMAILTACRHAL